MTSSDPTTRAEVRAAKDELLGVLARDRGVTAATAPARLPAGGDVLGVGWGAKQVGGDLTGQPALRVYVRSKLPGGQLASALRVPLEVNGVPTDVVAVGDLVAQVRPAPGGVSIAHVGVTAGTLGCLVRLDGEGEQTFVLSNNHVLANSNAAEVGDAVLQPGPIDGGTAEDQIGVLHAFVPIDTGGANEVDAAVASVRDPADVVPQVLTVGDLAGPPMDAALYQGVRKHGRTTGHTVGVVVDVAADVQVRFGNDLVEFVDQVAVVGAGGAFSDGGDSGSIVVDGVSRRPVGLLFAGGGGTTFMNPIDLVLGAIGGQVVTTATDDPPAG